MSDFKEFGDRERAGWTDDAIVNAYISHFGPVTDQAGAAILDRHVQPGDRVLDLCCGQGTLTARLARAGAKVTGLDFSPQMVGLAQKAAPDAQILEGDAAALPFEDASFDTVVCNFGMMHLPDQPKALREIARVLRPGGTFVMATWMAPPASPAFGAVFGALKEHADFSGAPPQPDLFTFADEGQAARLMAEAGLDMTSHGALASAWTVDAPKDLFDIFLTATVGARMLILSQSDETVNKIADTVAATVAQKFATGTGYEIPVNIALIAATRPA
ncbi:class I SAM-dependent methyltransferase [Roseovarius aestuariivivens]|uniref:class I SAM-dependent methyltransferase n=1 Tax=Roseovarius aestuariivivens TaxID=1888910 RepID=UPI0010811A6D|nr:class I SAM-dependent methyltransferase [Roseovarius aestuariivivens]